MQIHFLLFFSCIYEFLFIPLDKVLSLENTRENNFFLFFLGILLA